MSSAGSWDPVRIVLGFVVVGFVIGSHGLESVKPPLLDQANFELVARELDQGRVLYRDLFDVKPPLIYKTYQLIRNVFGDSHAAVVWVDAWLVLLTMFFMDRALRNSVPPRARAYGCLIWSIIIVMPQFGGDLALLQPETLVNLFIAGSLWVGFEPRSSEPEDRAPEPSRGREIGLGILVALAAFAKFVPAGMVLLSSLVQGGRGRWRFRLVTGLGVTVLAMGIWIFSCSLSGSLEALRGAVAYTSHRVSDASLIQKVNPMVYVKDLFIPSALAGFMVLQAGGSCVGRSLLVWFVTAALFVMMQGRFASYHFICVIPPLALLAGWGLHRWANSEFAPLSLAGPALAIVLLLAIAMDAQIGINTAAAEFAIGRLSREKMENNVLVTWWYSASDVRHLARLVKERTSPQDSVFVFGIVPQLYLFADRPFFSRYIFHYFLLAQCPLTEGYPGLDVRQRAFLEEFDSCPPAVVVLPESQSVGPGLYENAKEIRTFPKLIDRLDRDYRGERVGSVTLFFRRGPSSP